MNKLVRNRIPEIVKAYGEDAEFYTESNPQRCLELLQNKLIEESIEVAAAEGRAKILEELVDTWEVLNAIAIEIGASEKEFIAARELKLEEKGSFTRFYVMSISEQIGDNKILDISANPSQCYCPTCRNYSILPNHCDNCGGALS